MPLGASNGVIESLMIPIWIPTKSGGDKSPIPNRMTNSDSD